MIVAYRLGDRAVFLTGFAKKELENIDADQLLELRKIAQGWLVADDMTIRQALSDTTLQEVEDGQKN